MLTRYEQGSLTWVDLVNPNDVEVRAVMHEFGLHPLIAEQLLAPSQKSKVERYDGVFYLILTFPTLRGGHHTRSEQEIDFCVGKNFFITLQAHNEPYQLLFELGVIGVVIALLWVLQASVSSWVIWKSAPVARIPGPWYLWGRVPLERAWVAVLVTALVNMLGSPTFHLPGQAIVILFALARAQADADALSTVRVQERRHTRKKREAVHEATV